MDQFRSVQFTGGCLLDAHRAPTNTSPWVFGEGQRYQRECVTAVTEPHQAYAEVGHDTGQQHQKDQDRASCLVRCSGSIIRHVSSRLLIASAEADSGSQRS
eukprot:3295429-Rhodomonas_salina.3